MKKLVWIALLIFWGGDLSRTKAVVVTTQKPEDYKQKTKMYVQQYNELVKQLSEEVEGE